MVRVNNTPFITPMLGAFSRSYPEIAVDMTVVAQPKSIAEAIVHMIRQPPDVDTSEIVIRPPASM